MDYGTWGISITIGLGSLIGEYFRRLNSRVIEDDVCSEVMLRRFLRWCGVLWDDVCDSR